MGEPLLVKIPRDESLIWAAKLHGVAQYCSEMGCLEASNVIAELEGYFFRAIMEQLTSNEVFELTRSEKMETFPEFIGDAVYD